MFFYLISSLLSMAEKGDEDCDVIVVGAGLSGLTAAYSLKKTLPECNVIVVEAKGTYM